MYKIGITGTRNPITEKQSEYIKNFLKNRISLNTVENLEFHHGDCVGADVTAANIAQSLGIRTVCHPPEKDELRAYHASDLILPVKGYFARNRDIVNDTHEMIGIPMDTNLDAKIGGTIYTINYAVKQKRQVMVIFPSGQVTVL